jgi:hypothetical protein
MEEKKESRVVRHMSLASAVSNDQIDLVKFLLEEGGKDANEVRYN